MSEGQPLPQRRNPVVTESGKAAGNNETQTEKSHFFDARTTKVKPRDERDLLDTAALSKEYQEGGLRLRRLQEQANQLLGIFDPEDFKIAIGSTKKLDSIAEEMDNHNEEKEKSDGGVITYADVFTHNLSSLVKQLVLHENAQRVIRLAGRYAYGDRLTEYYSLKDMWYAGELNVKIGDLTVLDLLGADLRKKFAPYQIYSSFMRAYGVLGNNEQDLVLEENRGSDFTELYPNIFKHQIDGAANYFAALALPTPLIVNNSDRVNNGRSEVASRVKQVVSQVAEVRKGVYQVVTDPDSPHHPKLQASLESYLSGDLELRILALYVLGLDNPVNIYDLYSKSVEHVRQGKHPEFYSKLAQAIKEYAEEVPSLVGVLTEYDLDTIIDIQKSTVPIENVQVDNQASYAKTISSIFSKSSKDAYEIDPALIDWYQITPPQEVTVSFSPNTPKRFAIQLSYHNPEGEAMRVGIWFDMKRNGFFHWSFIENIDETTKFSDFYRSMVSITGELLRQADKQAEVLQAERKAQLNPIRVADRDNSTGKSKARPESTVPRRTDVRKEIKDGQDSDQAAHIVVDGINNVTSGIVKKELIIPPQDDHAKLVRRLSTEDQVRLFEEIEEYNRTQTGKFLPLKGRGPNGEILWSLRVNSKVPGQIRVLATQSESSEGLIRFQILDVQYRKDIYRRWDL